MDILAEAACLSAVIVSGLIDDIADILRPEHFYSEAHRRMYEAALALHAEGQPIDVVLVGTWLRDRERLAQVGGMAYLTEILNAAPAVANARHYADIVRSKYIARQVIAICTKHAARGYGDYGVVAEYVNGVAAEIHDIACDDNRGGAVKLGELVVLNIKAAQRASTTGMTGLATRLDRYDRMTAGLHRSELTIVAARPGMGKAQPLDEPVMTPTGWRPIGELVVGDRITRSDGTDGVVTGVFPQPEDLEVWRISFDDGAPAVECNAEHLWAVRGIKERKRGAAPIVITTAEIAASMGKRYSVPFVGPVELNGESAERRLVGLRDYCATAEAKLSNGGGWTEVSALNEDHADAIADDVRSLGGVAVVRRVTPLVAFGGAMHDGRPLFRVSFIWREERRIVAATPTGRLVPMVCISVDASDHLYVTTGYTLTHNTSLVLNWGENIATQPDADGALSNGFLIFSLEMDREQLSLRLLCAMAKVDIAKMRTGVLTPTDWSKLGVASSCLDALPIWIDDTTNLSIVDVRARARRVITQAATEGVTIKMVAIDYLQLMKSATGRDSREQEVSEVSRGLKALSKELKLPVVALSQMNRKNEERSNKRPQLSDLRECITGDQVVVDAMTGDRVTVREIANGRRVTVFGLGPDLKVRCAAVSLAWSTGVKKVWKVTTASGRTLRCSGNHPLRPLAGWRALDTLRVGDRIAVPRVTGSAIDPEAELSGDELRLLGYLVSDGSYGRNRSVSYVKADPVLVADVRRIARDRFGIEAREKPCLGVAEQVELTTRKTGPCGNPLIEWLKTIGIHGQIGTTKRTPRGVFRCDSRGLGIYLGALWAGDGSIVPRASGGWALKFTSTSMGLLDEVHELLTRLGVIACRGGRERNSKSTVDISTIVVSEADAILRFAEVIPVPGIKGERLAEAVVWCLQSNRNARIDRMPLDVTEQVEAAKQASGMSWRDLGYRCQGKEMCRLDLGRVAERLAHPGFAELADSDILWDTIESIVPDGEEETFDLRVPGLGNFVVNGIFAHNSGAIEQDADNIVFIHRDDYYNKDSSERGIAELIIAKQRNGPTDTVKVRFDAEWTRFSNLPEGGGWSEDETRPRHG